MLYASLKLLWLMRIMRCMHALSFYFAYSVFSLEAKNPFSAGRFMTAFITTYHLFYAQLSTRRQFNSQYYLYVSSTLPSTPKIHTLQMAASFLPLKATIEAYPRSLGYQTLVLVKNRDKYWVAASPPWSLNSTWNPKMPSGRTTSNAPDRRLTPYRRCAALRSSK